MIHSLVSGARQGPNLWVIFYYLLLLIDLQLNMNCLQNKHCYLIFSLQEVFNVLFVQLWNNFQPCTPLITLSLSTGIWPIYLTVRFHYLFSCGNNKTLSFSPSRCLCLSDVTSSPKCQNTPASTSLTRKNPVHLESESFINPIVSLHTFLFISTFFYKHKMPYV